MKITEQIQEEKFRLIEEWQQSSLTQKEFCKKVNIGYHIFHYWYKKYKSVYTQQEGPGFISLEVKESANKPSAEIFLSNGTRLVLKSVDSAFIRSLIY